MMTTLLRRPDRASAARHQRGPGTRTRTRLLAALLTVAGPILGAALVPSAASAQTFATIRQAPYIETHILAREVANDGKTRTVVVSVGATTRIPDPLPAGDPFTGYGNVEISLDFPGARVSSDRPSMSPAPAGPLDTTFCAPGAISCEVNPDVFLTEGRSSWLNVVLDVPCSDPVTVRHVLTARPDGYARPDVEYTGSVTSLGSMFCDPPWEDPTPRVFLPGVGTPIAPIGGGGPTIGLVPRPG